MIEVNHVKRPHINYICVRAVECLLYLFMYNTMEGKLIHENSAQSYKNYQIIKLGVKDATKYINIGVSYI